MKTIFKLILRGGLPLVAAGLAALFPASNAFGLAADYPPGGPGAIPSSWPPQLADMTNFPNRVGGYFINSDDFVAYKGDAAQFQTFLDACAAVTDAGEKTLHLHAGKGSFQGLNKDAAPAACDWKLILINPSWHTAAGKAASPVQSSARTLDLHLWLDGAVDFTKLKVPEGIKTVRTKE